jgi:hypothetical protein
MAVNVTEANSYIEASVIDIEDWQDADESKKQRILNVGSRVLLAKFPKYVIPDEAVYEYAASLATAFNDTNKLNNQGVASFSITGVASFNFKDTQSRELTAFIPRTALDLISLANDGANVGLKTVRWTVM